jgi:ubiquitin-protein ligase
MLKTEVLPLKAELEELVSGGHSADAVDAEGWAIVIFHEYPVPAGYSKRKIELLLKIPLSYPNGRPDMFWTDKDFVLANGVVPKSTELIEVILGKEWRRFSWHPQNWNPGVDDLRTYLEFVNNRLAKGV